MKDIKTYNVIAQEGLDELPADMYTVNKSTKPDALLIRSQDMHKTPFGTSVLAIARAGAGVNNIPLEKATSQGTAVFNTPGSNANAVKELIITMLLLSVRPVFASVKWAQKLAGADVSLQTEKGKNHFAGTELYGKKIGIIGLGNIGSRVAKACMDLGMKVIGYDPYISVEKAWQLSNDIPRAESLEELLEQSDFITIHIPYTDKNRNIIGEDEINVMKDTAVLLNYSRWGIVDEDITVTASDSKTAAISMVESMLDDDSEVVTIIYGEDGNEAEAKEIEQAILDIDDDLEVEIRRRSTCLSLSNFC